LKLTRECLNLLINNGFKILLITKSDIVKRDVDILTKAKVCVSFSLTTLDENKAKKLEPNAPLPKERLNAMQKLIENKIPVSIRLDPIIPLINDYEIEKLILYCADKEEITKEDIDKIIVPKFQENVFVFLDKFFAKDKQAVLMYKNLLQTSHPFELQSLILNYLNKLLIYKTLQNTKPPEEIFKQLNITHPFQKSSIQKLSKNVSIQDLINAVKSLYKAEISQKVFYGDPEKQSILFVSKFILGKG